MKTIKFRIYNPEDKKMVESGATPMMLHSFFEYTARFNTQYEMEYQQFTGLTDKLGKEIYEGDIVRNNWDKKIETIKDIRSINWLLSDGFLAGQEENNSLLDAEVIGNIHENPELL